MPAVPRILGRPSFEHGPERGQVGVPSNEIVHAACWAKVDIHAQLRATCLRKRELQVIDLERLRQDNSAAKIIFVWTRWSHGLAVMSHPMAPSGEAPERRPPDKVRELFEREAGVLVNWGIESAPQAALSYFAHSAIGRRTRSRSVVIEISIAVGGLPHAHSLSKTSQELQTA